MKPGAFVDRPGRADRGVGFGAEFEACGRRRARRGGTARSVEPNSRRRQRGDPTTPPIRWRPRRARAAIANLARAARFASRETGRRHRSVRRGAAAAAFTHRGWRVVDNRERDPDLAVDRFERADLGTDGEVANLFARLSGEGPMEALVNNAAVGLDKPLRDTTDDDWKRDINLRSAFQCGGAAISGPGEGARSSTSGPCTPRRRTPPSTP